jgi:hypothetical protein
MTEGVDFEHHIKKDQTDYLDFTICNKKNNPLRSYHIDVKTNASTQYEPFPDWGCDVTENQHEKMKLPENTINRLVFVKYKLDDNTCRIVGWMSLRKFQEKAKYLPKGTVIPGGSKTNTGMWEVKISELKKYKI